MNSLNPWNTRRETLQEDREFRRLLNLHQLTDAWIQSIESKQTASHQLERKESISLSPNLWLYEKSRMDHLSMNLSELVGAQEVREFLNELSQTLWTIQVSSIENAFHQAVDKISLKNILESATWDHGKLTAETVWGKLKIETLQDAYNAFIESHFFGDRAFLLIRSTHHELSFRWSRPLNHAPVVQDPFTISTLSDLYGEWISGFFYGLSRQIKFSKQATAEVTTFTLLWTS